MTPWPAMLTGLSAGVAARLSLLDIDYRRYPGYPHGYINHVALGVIAALLGAVMTPALAEHNYAAVTFLALVAQEFRDVRRIERESLDRLETVKLVPRGAEYIEGVARVFEARNYLVMGVALFSSAATYLVGLLGSRWPQSAAVGALVGGALTFCAHRAKEGHHVRDIAAVRPASIRFAGPLLWIEDIALINIGDPQAREQILEHGVAAILEPVDLEAAQTLADPGQRQAMIHDASRAMGHRRDVDTPQFAPVARLHLETGRLGVFMVPLVRDPQRLVQVLQATPVLQSSRGSLSLFRGGR